MHIGYIVVTAFYLLFLGAAWSEVLSIIHEPENVLNTNLIMFYCVLLGMFNLYVLQRCAKVIDLQSYIEKLRHSISDYRSRRRLARQLGNRYGVQIDEDHLTTNPYLPNPPVTRKNKKSR